MNNMDKKLVLSASVLLSLGACDKAMTATHPSDMKKPNIVVIVADDLGWGDLGYNGSAIKTPNIDRFSESGI